MVRWFPADPGRKGHTSETQFVMGTALIVSGTCDTREEVLKRDGTGVTVDSACKPTAGKWYSVYDSTYITTSSSIDIDHIVPLAGTTTHTGRTRDRAALGLVARRGRPSSPEPTPSRSGP
jgi:hypothetical protein